MSSATCARPTTTSSESLCADRRRSARDITRRTPLGDLARRDFIIDEADDSYDAFPQARALGSSEPVSAGTRRFIIDFANGDLKYFQSNPSMVEVVPTVTNGKIVRSFIVPNPHTGGFRAGIDVALDPGQSADLRAFLKAGTRTLTETWTFPWKAE